MRLLLACALGIEIVLTSAWLSARLQMLALYGVVTLLTIGVRVFATALQAAAVYALAQRSRQAATLTTAALVASAVTLTLEIGARLVPSSVFPSHRWPIVVSYWAYAALGVVAAGTLRR